METVEAPPDVDWAHRLVDEGRAHWSGGKPAGASRPPQITGRTPQSIPVDAKAATT